MNVALHLGIGLIRIDHELVCHRSVLASTNRPIPANLLRTELLYQLGLVTCQLCGGGLLAASADNDAVFLEMRFGPTGSAPPQRERL